MFYSSINSLKFDLSFSILVDKAKMIELKKL